MVGARRAAGVHCGRARSIRCTSGRSSTAAISRARPAYGVEVFERPRCLGHAARGRGPSAPIPRRSRPGSYAQEKIELPDGGVAREYPAPALRRRASRRTKPITSRDIVATTLQGVALGFVGWWLAVWLADGGARAPARVPPVRCGARCSGGRPRCPGWRVLLTVLVLALIAVPVAVLATQIPRARHRQGGPGRALPFAQVHPHQPGHRHADHAGDAAVRHRSSASWRATSGAGSTTSIQYVYTTLNSIPGVLLIAAAVLMVQVLHRHEPGLVPYRRAARGLPAAAALRDPRPDHLDRPRAPAARRGAEAVASSSTSRRRMRSACVTRASSPATSCPNVMHIVLIALVMDFSGLVLAEAVLSYVGVGVDPIDDELRHDDQRRPSGDGARADGLVGAGGGLRFHVRAGPRREPVRRRGARRVRSAGRGRPAGRRRGRR